MVRQLAPYYTDEQIAFMLNMKHLRTGSRQQLHARSSGLRATRASACRRPIRPAYPIATIRRG